MLTVRDALKDVRVNMLKGKQTRFTQILLTHLAAMKWGFLSAMCCTWALALADLLRPWPLKIIIDNILLDKPLPHYLTFLAAPFAQQKTLSVIVVSCTIIVISVYCCRSHHSIT